MNKHFSVKEYKMRLRGIIIFIMSIIVLLCIIMTVNTVRMNSYANQSIELSKAHMQYNDIASKLTLGSDILTEQVRLFAETGKTKYIYEYFEEAKVLKHRDKAIKELKEILPTGKEKHMIEKSMEESNKLMEREFYSMKLAAYGYGLPPNDIPFKEVTDVELTEEDTALSPEEAKLKAREMLFDEIYLESKRKIKSGASDFLDKMLGDSENEYFILSKKVENYLKIQTVIIALFFLFMVTTMLFKFFYVVNPIIEASKNIKNGLPINMPVFLTEMDSMGSAYNSLRTKNAELMEKFRVVAEIDALTNLGNRLAYNTYNESLKKKGGRVLMFLFDVNKLREKNNTEGHAAGDRLLVDTSICIKNVFADAAGNNCFRIGGDEFVAYVCGEPAEKAQAYIDEFEKECEKYGIGVSVGYSYAENISAVSEKRLFSTADERMYRKKYGDNAN